MHSGQEEEKMLIKAGVDISRLERNTRRGLGKADVIFESYGEEMVVSSTFEGNHGAGSLHYADRAWDNRLPQGNIDAIVFELKEKLGPDFDVVRRPDHIHNEYDPK